MAMLTSDLSLGVKRQTHWHRGPRFHHRLRRVLPLVFERRDGSDFGH